MNVDPAIIAYGAILLGPSADGDEGQALLTDGEGVLYFGDAGGGAEELDDLSDVDLDLDGLAENDLLLYDGDNWINAALIPTAGTVTASKAVVPDANKDALSFRYLGASRFQIDGDSDTYIASPGADELAITVGGLEAMRITESGGVLQTTLTQNVLGTHALRINGADAATPTSYPFAVYNSENIIRTRITNFGSQEWFLGAVGQILFTTPGGHPGIRIERAGGARLDFTNTTSGIRMEGTAVTNLVLSRTGSVGNACILSCLGATSTSNNRDAFTIVPTFADSVDATRKSRAVFNIFSAGGAEEALRIESSGSAAMIGFLGADAVARQSHIADPSGGSTEDSQARTAINAILDALEAYGLLATS